MINQEIISLRFYRPSYSTKRSPDREFYLFGPKDNDADLCIDGPYDHLKAALQSGVSVGIFGMRINAEREGFLKLLKTDATGCAYDFKIAYQYGIMDIPSFRINMDHSYSIGFVLSAGESLSIFMQVAFYDSSRKYLFTDNDPVFSLYKKYLFTYFKI